MLETTTLPKGPEALSQLHLSTAACSPVSSYTNRPDTGYKTSGAGKRFSAFCVRLENCSWLAQGVGLKKRVLGGADRFWGLSGREFFSTPRWSQASEESRFVRVASWWRQVSSSPPPPQPVIWSLKTQVQQRIYPLQQW